MARFRSFLLFACFALIMTALIVPLIQGDPLATLFLSGSAAVTAVAAAIFLLILRDATRYSPWHNTAFRLLAGVTLAGSYYFFGVTSAVVMMVPIGAYVMGLGESFRAALLTHLNVQLSHLAISVLQLVAIIPDVGFVGPTSAGLAQRIGILFAIQGIFIAAFVMARGNRRSTLATLEALNDAVTDNARRQALLSEAKQALALAHQVGGPGRYSEQTFGNYRLANVLGRGAMGEVYEAYHLQTEEPAALKLLNQESLQDANALERFLREVEIAKTLREENIVEVLEVSRLGDPIPYLVMERLQGHTLSTILQDKSSMPPPELTTLIHELTRGIAAAHKAGIVHRDLKPSNIFLHRGEKTSWKILDFGVSKFMDAGDTFTAGAIIGTPAYMSPEQARSAPVSARTDLYALGVIAYRTLTGRPAFTGDDLPAVLHSVVYDMPPMPSQIADLSVEYDYVLAIAMAKDPADRFASAEELSAAFEAIEAGSLPTACLQKGAALIAKHPWGTRAT